MNNKAIILTGGAILLSVGVYAAFFHKPEYPEPNEPEGDTGSYAYDTTMKPTQKNFSLSEFACHDGTPVPVEYYGNVQRLMDNLQVLRDAVGFPIVINSGYRTPSYNAKIGGVSSSQHLLAKAADIRIPGMSPASVRAKIEDLIAAGKMQQGGLGAYATFSHYDVRGYKARWNG